MMKGVISYYLSAFLRRIHWFLVIFLSVASVALALAKFLPPSYVSEARLLVEPPQIPGQLLAPTVQVAPTEELQIIEQQLMTRTNLLNIARSQRAFDDIDSMSPDEIVSRMRRATGIRRIAGRGQATLMFVSFSSANPRTAANVVNEYVTTILQNNARTRTERATNTLEFFQDEVERLGKLLQEQSARITEFKNANIDALPDTLNYRLNQQTTLQERLAAVGRQISSLEEQRRNIVEMFRKTGQVSGAAASAMTPEQQQLLQLQDSLTQALAVYSPDNPKVKLLEAQIARQKEIVAKQAGNAGGDPNSPATLLDINLASIDAQIRLLESQRAQITQQLDALKETLERTPANTIRLDALNRDYMNTQAQYNNAVSSLAQASMGERIETLSRGQRIVVLDPATVPAAPASPNRLLIALGGILGGAALGLAAVALLEFLDKSVRRPADLTRHLGISPIATVPYIRTPMEMVMRRAAFTAILLAIVIGIPAAIWAVHTYYLPLDLLYERVAQRLGELI